MDKLEGLTPEEKKLVKEIGGLINKFSCDVALSLIGKGKVPDIVEVSEKVYFKAQLAKALKHEEDCPECDGTGGSWVEKDDAGNAIGSPCDKCQGTGKRDRPDIPTLTSNIGCMSKSKIEEFAGMVLRECGYPHKMKWTTAGDILIGEIIYIDERHIDEYPYMVKERVLHEIAHIDTHPQDDGHGEYFHSRLSELIEQFMGRSSYHG